MVIPKTHTERKRLRLKGFDYSQDNGYFVTICIKSHDECFGTITDDRMELNVNGKIAHQQFEWIQNQYPYVKIPVWIIMPDHVHAIIVINRNFVNDKSGTGRDLSRPNKIKPLPELIGAYKTTTSKQIHLAGFNDFRWQRSYHERIIRSKTAYERIFSYIQNNPGNYRTNNNLK